MQFIRLRWRQVYWINITRVGDLERRESRRERINNEIVWADELNMNEGARKCSLRRDIQRKLRQSYVWDFLRDMIYFTLYTRKTYYLQHWHTFCYPFVYSKKLQMNFKREVVLTLFRNILISEFLKQEG